jgi:peptidoglycan/xylan/chitin deacetylase (PgdA/CDA1 family)
MSGSLSQITSRVPAFFWPASADPAREARGSAVRIAALLGHVQQKRMINLTFHGLGAPPRPLDDGEAAVWVDTSRFEALLDAVAGRHDVRITFDDGNASDLTIGLPALAERNLTATFFVVAGRLGQEHFLSAGQVRALRDAGMRIGNHGMHHQAWRGLDATALDEELGTARRLLEDVVGAPVDEAACPFGAYDRRVVGALRRGGYRHVYTSDRGTTDDAAWLQPRNTMTPGDGPEAIAAITAAPSSAARTAKLALKRWR